MVGVIAISDEHDENFRQVRGNDVLDIDFEAADSVGVLCNAGSSGGAVTCRKLRNLFGGGIFGEGLVRVRDWFQVV